MANDIHDFIIWINTRVLQYILYQNNTIYNNILKSIVSGENGSFFADDIGGDIDVTFNTFPDDMFAFQVPIPFT